MAPCNAVREVWVPSRFNKRTFAQGGVNPDRIHVVPYPVDTERLRPGPRERPPGTPVTFLSIFEWTWRKGWDVLLRAWAEEFAPDEPGAARHRHLPRPRRRRGRAACTSRRSATWRRSASRPTRSPTSTWCSTPSPTRTCRPSTRSADAFVLPTRGEGAGMPVLEAAACGVPVIATAWGGHEELMTDATAFPVEVERMVQAPPALLVDNGLYAGLRLAEPSVASLRAGMRAVADDPAGAAARGLRGRALVRGALLPGGHRGRARGPRVRAARPRPCAGVTR